MTAPIDATWLRETIAAAITAAVADVAATPHTLPSDASARSKRFVTRLGAALDAATRKGFPYEPNPVQSHYLDKAGMGGAATPEFLWDIFVGQYGSDETGAAHALIRGHWAVESELDRDFQKDFNKLVVAHVDHRLFILPTGTRQVSGLQSQCRVAKVSCWIAEVDPLDKWSSGADCVPWVKVQFISAGR